MSEDNEYQFDPYNFCVRLESSDDVEKLQRTIMAIRPEDHTYSEDVAISMEPYWGVFENRLHQSAIEWRESIPIGLLMVNVIAYRLKQVIDRTGIGKTGGITVHKWAPEAGEHVWASFTGKKWNKVVFMYKDQLGSNDRYYSVPLDNIQPTELESGQKIIKLTAYPRIKPITE